MPASRSAKGSKRFAQNEAHGAASKFGQIIGEAFAATVYEFIESYLQSDHPNFLLLAPSIGKQLVRLEMMGGTSRQLDNVIVPKDSNDPVALFESKWLKDARHHNDKGAWILQLREIRKKHPAVRGAAAHLAGYWTEGVGVMFETEGGITTVIAATDEEVYSTLQEPLHQVWLEHGIEPFELKASEIRQSLPRPWDLANGMMTLVEQGRITALAKQWLKFRRQTLNDGSFILGSDLIAAAIDQLLQPLPSNPQIKTFEIALQIDTGNIIYAEFTDFEDAVEFLRAHVADPKAILSKITPRSG